MAEEACMAGGVHGGGHAWQGEGHAWQEKRQLQRAVCILLVCTLVVYKCKSTDALWLITGLHSLERCYPISAV